MPGVGLLNGIHGETPDGVDGELLGSMVMDWRE